VLDTAPIGQSAGSALERQYAQRHGLQEMHGARIQVPRAPRERPDPERLERRYERFLSAAA
jgi:hypothetical protein